MNIESRKVCMVGDFGVGKTSSVERFVNNVFSDKYLTTIGVKVDTKVIEVNNAEIKLVVWDIAGRNRFGNIEFTYLRGSASYLLVVDGTRRSTLVTALELRDSIEERYGQIPYVMLINKADLEEEWEITEEDISDLKSQEVKVFITSAKTGDNIEEAFIELSQALALK